MQRIPIRTIRQTTQRMNKIGKGSRERRREEGRESKRDMRESLCFGLHFCGSFQSVDEDRLGEGDLWEGKGRLKKKVKEWKWNGSQKKKKIVNYLQSHSLILNHIK